MKGISKNTIAILIASFFSYQMYISSALLAPIYAWFPNIDPNVTILVYTGPTLLSAVIAFVLSPLMTRINKKWLVVLGLGCIVAGGLDILLLGGASFPMALIGTLLCGAGYAFVINATNALLVELDPMSAASTVAMNAAAGCLGSMLIMLVAGVLAKDGNWTRAYWVCIPAAIALVLFLLLFRDDKKAQQPAAQQAAQQDMPPQAADAGSRNVGLFVCVVLIFFLAMLNNTAWNANSSTYIIADKQIGTTVETSMVGTLASLGGVIGGFFLTGIASKIFKSWTVPACLILVMAPNVAAFLGTTSIMVIYVCAFIFMMAFNPVYGKISAAAGKLMPGGAGVSIINGVMGLGGFIAPYILGFISGNLGGGTRTQFAAGVVFIVIAIVISIPTMKKAEV